MKPIIPWKDGFLVLPDVELPDLLGSIQVLSHLAAADELGFTLMWEGARLPHYTYMTGYKFFAPGHPTMYMGGGHTRTWTRIVNAYRNVEQLVAIPADM